MTATPASSAETAPPLVELRNTSKTFSGIKVLKNVGFDVRPGEVHALLGENGAGKSTLIKILSGFHTPDEGGEIRVNGRPVSFSSPRDARKAGIATVYQELLLFPDMTVAENIFIGHAPRAGMGALDWNEMRRRARALLDDLDSHDLDVDARVGGLSVANRQRVEIAKALSQDARLLIMDEPTASLADADVRRLLDLAMKLEGLEPLVEESKADFVDNALSEFDTGKMLTARLLGRPVPPTAIFACNDMMAFGVIRELSERNIRVPQDISVIGFDGIDLGQMINPQLTTIKQPDYEMGKLACKMLLDKMNGADVPAYDIILQPELLERGSVEPR